MRECETRLLELIDQTAINAAKTLTAAVRPLDPEPGDPNCLTLRAHLLARLTDGIIEGVLAPLDDADKECLMDLYDDEEPGPADEDEFQDPEYEMALEMLNETADFGLGEIMEDEILRRLFPPFERIHSTGQCAMALMDVTLSPYDPSTVGIFFTVTAPTDEDLAETSRLFEQARQHDPTRGLTIAPGYKEFDYQTYAAGLSGNAQTG